MQLLFQKKRTMPDEHLSLYLSLCDRYQALYAKKPQKPKIFEDGSKILFLLI